MPNIQQQTLIHRRDDLTALTEELRQANKTIVFTNGCFDLLHAGHVICLQDAKARGDVLIVGLNTDESVQRLKGEGRPIIPCAARALMLVALDVVDYVVLFNEDTPDNILAIIKPDVLVKGGGTPWDDIPGKEHAAETVRVQHRVGHSTTGIIERIEQRAIARMRRVNETPFADIVAVVPQPEGSTVAFTPIIQACVVKAEKLSDKYLWTWDTLNTINAVDAKHMQKTMRLAEQYHMSRARIRAMYANMEL